MSNKLDKFSKEACLKYETGNDSPCNDCEDVAMLVLHSQPGKLQ